MPVQTHKPIRRWATLWLVKTCTCGRWKLCKPPQWFPPAPIPDGVTVPWPVNQRRYR